LIESLFSISEAERPGVVHRITAIGFEIEALACRPARFEADRRG
jgi:hypothetical protein